MKIRFRKNVEMIVALVFVLPYFDWGWIVSRLTISYEDVYIKGLFIFSLGVCFILDMVLRKKNRHILWDRLDFIFLFFGLTVLGVGIIRNLSLTMWSFCMWIVGPIYMSSVLYKICIFRQFSIKKVIHYGIFLFTLYILVCFFYNFEFRGMKLNSATIGRLTSPGGGPVIFGYTVIIMMEVYLYYCRKYNLEIRIGVLLLYSIAAALTGSRGAVWFLPIIFLFYCFYMKNNVKKIITVVLGMILFIMINPIQILFNLMPRLGRTTDVRLSVWANSLSMWNEQGLLHKIFGYGWGEFFKYQKWINCLDKSSYYKGNMVLYDGRAIVVQPHNTGIYLLIEGGIIAVLMFLAIFVVAMYRKATEKTSSSFLAIGIMVSMLLLNCFDAIFLIEPLVATQWWFIFMLLAKDKENEKCELQTIY